MIVHVWAEETTPVLNLAHHLFPFNVYYFIQTQKLDSFPAGYIVLYIHMQMRPSKDG